MRHEGGPEAAGGHKVVAKPTPEFLFAEIDILTEDGYTVEVENTGQRVAAPTKALTGSHQLRVAGHCRGECRLRR